MGGVFKTDKPYNVEQNIREKICIRRNKQMYLIKAVTHSPFKFIFEVMKSGELKVIKVPYLGKFGVKPGRKRYLEQQAKEKAEKGNTDNQEQPPDNSGKP